MQNIPNLYLFPNCVDIFTHEYSDEDFDKMSKSEKDMFKFAVFPLLKHRWKSAYVVKHNNVIKLNKENVTKTSKDTIWKKVNRSTLKTIHVTSVDKKKRMFKSGKSLITYECYAFLKCDINKDLNSFDEYTLRGLMDAGNKLKIFSNSVGNAKNTINVLGNNKPFSVVPLASLKPVAQREIFSAWINKQYVILTGGTGVGKTSQVPKLLLWFNYLFGGFLSYSKVSNFEEKPIVLSLPRIALVRMHGNTFLSALGFSTWTGSPISIKFSAISEEEINKNPRPYGMVISTHKLTLSNLFNFSTIILDEVHEHDQIGDIVISVTKKKFKELDSVFLMTATLEDDRERFTEFLPNPVFIHIPGDTLFPISDVYIRNSVSITDYRNYTAQELKNISTAIKKYTPPAKACGIVFVATVSQCKAYLDFLAKELPSVTFFIIHGKIINIDEIINKIYSNEGVSIIISTPYLESSVTIKNATHVYDTGKVFIPYPFGGKQRIISLSMRDQRRGRVGRTRPGTYVYFYDTKYLKPIIRIDSEFLHPYVLYAKYFNLNLPDDLLIIPSDLTLLNKTIEYIDSFNISNDQWMKIISNYYITMVEYAKLYVKGKSLAIEMDNFERFGIMTDNVFKNIISLQLRAKIISSRYNNVTYIHNCKVMFGPFSGTMFKVAYKRALKGYIYMITETTFVPETVVN
ncbi:RNA helicase, dexh-nph-ii domain [Pteropox virus]|uniref:RNA helicase NPH-II n=1 Tax=Pteropox virus TaxID=1873698 RepID=A0A1B1MRC5_9POXV|nr:RNA helicase, dexh-nph-ii domain [Pteropox virus]ANS71138.1 RNA helicase, dexh-nph-ii domain [Pteropox virus]